MDLKNQLQEHMKEALKARETTRLGVLRMLISEVKKREIDQRITLDEPQVHKVIQSLIIQRQDSIEAFQKGNRQDLVEKEKEEISVLQAYLPQPLSLEEIEKIVTSAIAESGATRIEDLGKVMKIALTKAAGRADGKVINEITRKKLSPS